MALPRPPSAAELTDLRALAERMTNQVSQARKRSSSPIPVADLEGQVGGAPVLPDGLADNPLVGGVGGVIALCPPDAPTESAPDWRYCPQTGRFAPTIPR